MPLIRRHLGLACSLAVGFLAATLLCLWGRSVDGWLEDAVWASQPETAGDRSIVIIEISDATLKKWPEPLALMGSRFGALTDALRTAGAKMAVFDFVHSAEPDGLLDAWGSSVLPNQIWADAIDRWPEGVAMGVTESASGSLLTPSGDILVSGTVAERLGAIDIGIRTSEVNREVELYVRSAEGVLPSLPMQAYSLSRGTTARRLIESDRLEPVMRLSAGRRWQTLGAEHVVSGNLSQSQWDSLNGAVAIVAMTHSGSRDVHLKPGRKAVIGAQIVADVLSALQSRESLRVLPQNARTGFLLVLALLFPFACQAARGWALPIGTLSLLALVLMNWPALLFAGIVLPAASAAAIVGTSSMAYALGTGITSRLEQRDLTDLFAQQLSPQIADHLLTYPEARRLSGEVVDATAMIFDLRGFTSFSEKAGPQRTFEELNRVFAFVLPIVKENNGVVVTLLGDGFLAVFGAPVTTKTHASEALRASMAIQRAITLDNGELGFGIGLSSGSLLFGNLGSRERRQFTLISDVVNLASRLQDECKNLNAEIVADQTTLSLAEGEWPELSGSAEVKARGRASSVQVRFFPRT